MQRIILEALAGQTQLHVLFDLKRKFRWLVSFTSSVRIPNIGAGLVPKPPWKLGPVGALHKQGMCQFSIFSVKTLYFSCAADQ